MSTDAPILDLSAPAGGQTLRLPGSSRAVSLHEQLYRYADDLQAVVEHNAALSADNARLRISAASLMESREELEAIVENSLDIHFLSAGNGTLLQWNPASVALAPASALRDTLLGDWIEPSHAAEFEALLVNAAQGHRSPPNGVELRLRPADPQRQAMIVTATVLPVRRGTEGHHLHWILRDITYLRETEFETKVANVVFNNSNQGAVVTDVEGGILAVNSAFTEITGYARDEVIGRCTGFLGSGHQGPEFYEAFWQSLRTSGTWQGHLFNRRKNGETYPEKLTVNAVRDANGQILSYIGVFTDLSRSCDEPFAGFGPKGRHDLLTGLPSRELIDDRLGRLISLARRTPIPFSLVHLDLEAFGRINAAHGHLVGDLVLREVARRLETGTRESDTVARIGADDFLVLAPNLACDPDRHNFVEKLRNLIARPMEVGGVTLQVAASIGCASHPADAGDAPGLFVAAERAMLEDKAAREARLAQETRI